MAYSFDFTNFVTRLEDLKIAKTGWDEVLLSFTTAWNENSYTIKSTASRVKSFIVSKYGKVPPELRDELSALISGRLKPAPGEGGLRLKENTPDSIHVPNEGKVGKPVSRKKPSNSTASLHISRTAESEMSEVWTEQEYLSIGDMSDAESTASDYVIVQGPPPDTREPRKKTLIKQLQHELHEVNLQLEVTHKEIKMQHRCIEEKENTIEEMKTINCTQGQEIDKLNQQLKEVRKYEEENQRQENQQELKHVKMRLIENEKTISEQVKRISAQANIVDDHAKIEYDIQLKTSQITNLQKALKETNTELEEIRLRLTTCVECLTKTLDNLQRDVENDNFASKFVFEGNLAEMKTTEECVNNIRDMLKKRKSEKDRCALTEHQNMEQQIHHQQTRLEQLWTTLHADEDNPTTESSEKKCPDDFDVLSEQICCMVKRIQQELKDRFNSNGELTEQLQQYDEDMKRFWNALQKSSSTKPTRKPPNDIDKLSKEIHEQVEKFQKETSELHLSVAELQKKVEQTNQEPKEQKKSTRNGVEDNSFQVIEELHKKLAVCKNEKENLLMRLSKAAGAKMTAGNPNIADLSDPNRPQKIVEQYSELYDIEWTDAFGKLEAHGMTGKKAVSLLLNILFEAYSFCVDISSKQRKSLISAMFYPAGSIEHLKKVSPTTIHEKMLTDLRKQTTTETVLSIKLCFEQKLKDMKGMKDSEVCTVYINRCVELCWIMCIQSPPVFLDVDRSYTEFDKDCLKPYTKSGEHVRYLVWPPLYIEKGGGLLMKGVAQGK